ncbi:MAG: molybdopterin-dependent oxidoreductase [Epsilonproteobacteria bacterium]|nr:molybdopterin-dependent oxidoreductase [Campylobacterota bacterium]
MIKTACGLDCPDACGIVADKELFPKIKADTSHPTSSGALCSLLNKYMFEEPRITKAKVNNSEVTLEEALEATAKALQAESKLLWRGSGNFGVMQEITNLLFEKIEGTTTKGSLCDGAGDAGIIEGRGVNRILPPEQIAKADVVVVWGKNITVTAPHLMPYIEGKKLVVIDPIETAIAKKADLFLQIKPRSDFYTAVMLARFIIMADSENKAYIEEFASEHEDFYDFTRGFRVKAVLEHIGAELGDMGRVIEYLNEKNVVFLVGNGVQKYSTGNFTLQAIDALATILGQFGKEGSGVSFFGNSKLDFKNPFETKGQKVQKATTNFGDFDTVLIQGGNPVASMPNTARVIEELKQTKTVIYFGLYENETSAMADIIIPAKNFFEKEDVRLSYAHHTVVPMHTVQEVEYGISEYDFSSTLLQKLGFDALQSEEHYLNLWLEQCEMVNGYYRSPAYQAIPYKDGFGEDGDEEFTFIEEHYDDFESNKRLTKVRKKSKKEEVITEYWLVTPKANNALNTQFKRDNQITIHSSLGFADGETIIAYSDWGEHEFVVKCSNSMRNDTVLIYANAKGVNYLTPNMLSDEGDNACYQEVKIKIKST